MEKGDEAPLERLKLAVIAVICAGFTAGLVISAGAGQADNPSRSTAVLLVRANR